MKTSAKWFAAGGSLLLIVGFLLPVISVSIKGAQKFISLLQVAGVSYWFFLYLIPLCAVAIALLALIPATGKTMAFAFLAGQVVGLVGIALLLLGSLVFLLVQPQLLTSSENIGGLLGPQFHNQTVSFWPSIGLFILVFGFGFAAFGIVAGLPPLQKPQAAVAVTSKAAPPIEATPSPSQADEVTSVSKEVYLEGKNGNFNSRRFPITNENFSIGRSRDNDLQLQDKKVSRIHARIRFSQGSWYIQDQQSKSGTHVNGKIVSATRLNSGDHIKIGDDVFIFHWNP